MKGPPMQWPSTINFPIKGIPQAKPDIVEFKPQPAMRRMGSRNRPLRSGCGRGLFVDAGGPSALTQTRVLPRPPRWRLRLFPELSVRSNLKMKPEEF
jgi:hypothetical protein